ncbi:precorrin-2 dehydrogenase/sirohydrochlorin ferrochelatase family protein [Chondromyces crocatus]|uniref:precorrin-2 dehydrogenase n=1 Tax=Chondromyces crocatus TaxID=52 RepID=A0A0K1E927_CHOCO|nr:NAD(P)-dependent oxidoreductase [Chondromyces crocatus]AKT37391.1 uncharacterized protein CMC5_015270 [Chondromyces crocatus]
MQRFPIALDLRDRDALILGAHGEAPQTAERLLAAGARVTVIAPGSVHETIAEAAARGRLTLHRRPFQDTDLDGRAIVFLAPFDDDLSRRLHQRLAAEGRLVCTLDRPEFSTFANLAVARVSGLTMAFGTDGVSPSTARRIREDLTTLFSDPRFARYLDALRQARAALPRGEERMARMRAAVEGFAIEARLRFPDWFDKHTPADWFDKRTAPMESTATETDTASEVADIEIQAPITDTANADPSLSTPPSGPGAPPPDTTPLASRSADSSRRGE